MAKSLMSAEETARVVDVATALVRQVGARIREVATSSEKVSVDYKGISDIVTEIDVWSEGVIIEAVTEHFPRHLVVGEETSTELSKTREKSLPEIVAENICWVVDPLDGTSNFSNKIPHSAVSIGVVNHGERVVGVVFDPYRDELFVAVKGQGAFLNGRRIQASTKTKLVQSLVAIGFPNDRWSKWHEYKDVTTAIIMSCRNVRACGAAAIEAAWVACGRFDGFFEYGIKAWDVAAGSLLVEEAGGKIASVGNAHGEDFSLFARGFLFAGADVYEELDRVIKTGKPNLPEGATL